MWFCFSPSSPLCSFFPSSVTSEFDSDITPSPLCALCPLCRMLSGFFLLFLRFSTFGTPKICICQIFFVPLYRNWDQRPLYRMLPGFFCDYFLKNNLKHPEFVIDKLTIICLFINYYYYCCLLLKAFTPTYALHRFFLFSISKSIQKGLSLFMFLKLSQNY